MQNELLQFKLLNVWSLVDLLRDKWAIGTNGEFLETRRMKRHSGKETKIMDASKVILKRKIEEEAPRAWYETLSTYLLDNGFYKGQIDKTLFIRRHKDYILLVQVYVDDIIFGSTKKEMSTEFEKLMHDKFQMSFMGELSFFLGLQVKQKIDGIFISQDKYVAEILKKFDLASLRQQALWMEYLKGQPKLGLWYPEDYPFDLEAFSDSDYAGASLDRKSHNRRVVQFLGKEMIFMDLVPLRKVGDEAVHKELGDRMERGTTTASSSEA
ncbi:putative ribonuclease H-like domain-containing protein [Tanacetum coccineum]